MGNFITDIMYQIQNVSAKVKAILEVTSEKAGQSPTDADRQ
jgi:hypothetical protein